MPVGADDPDAFTANFPQQLLAGWHGGIALVVGNNRNSRSQGLDRRANLIEELNRIGKAIGK